jgi:hypothetical protein
MLKTELWQESKKKYKKRKENNLLQNTNVGSVKTNSLKKLKS